MRESGMPELVRKSIGEGGTPYMERGKKSATQSKSGLSLTKGRRKRDHYAQRGLTGRVGEEREKIVNCRRNRGGGRSSRNIEREIMKKEEH